MVVLKLSEYNEIVNDIKSYSGLTRFCKAYLIEKYPTISHFTLGSILSTQLKWRMMTHYRKSASINTKYFNEYQKCKDSGEPPGILLRLSVKMYITPSLLARCILGHYCEVDGRSKTSPSQLIKDSTLIEDRDLAYEVYLSSLFDNEYGPYVNSIKQCIGQEYEQRLEFELRTLDIAFIGEDILRSKGYDKTPDFKLILPIAVDGFVINWIESKALFGDYQTHAGYLKDQLLCYWNRFGPGMVIYWFGYVDKLEKSPESDKIILRDMFPAKDSITVMNLN